MKRLFSTRSMIIVLSFLISLIFYAGVSVLVLSVPKIKNVSKTESRVPRSDTESYTVLTSCDQLLQYSAVQVNLTEKRITITLFSSVDSAENYGFNYDRRICYSPDGERDIISLIGGIVINEKSGYNGDISGQEIPCRIFGKTALNFAKRGTTERSAVAQSLVSSLLCANLTNDDFSYICERVSGDISFADFYNMYEKTCPLAKRITVVNECENN